MNATQLQEHSHYDKSYYNWQKGSGVLTAKVIASRIKPYIRPTDCVLDFGCGGGFLLAELDCAKRRGVEINPFARAQAIQNGAECSATTDEVPAACADVIVSNSCIEHVESPLTELRQLHPKLRVGGGLIVLVPHETLASRYRPKDVNQHLYAWSPMALGNLVTLAGFEVVTVKIWREMRPPLGPAICDRFGVGAVRFAAKLYRTMRMMLWPIRPVDCHADIMVVARRKH